MAWGDLKRYLALIVCIACTAAAAQPCPRIEKPAAGSILTSMVCTVSVSGCPDMRSVVFRAKYLAEDDLTWNIATLGTLTRKPFTLIWNIADLPNQLYTGMSFLAEATFSDGSTREIKQEGIFLVHKPIQRPQLAIPYTKREKVATGKPLRLMTAVSSATGAAHVGWNENELLFHIEILDRAFYADLPKKKYAKLGVEILLDPNTMQSPFPSEDAHVYVVPLMGKPYRVVTKGAFTSDGAFSLVRSTAEVDYYTAIQKEDFRGYAINFAIPWHAFGAQRSRQMGINVIAKALDNNGDVRKLSWIQESANAMYCPVVWGEAFLGRRPLFANLFYLWLVSFIGGVGIGAGAAWWVRWRRRSGDTVRKFETSEEEAAKFTTIKTAIEANITNRDFTLDALAGQLSIPAGFLNRLIRRNAGAPFITYLMRSRVEIAKERLRSSHSSETAIASLCGFASVDEMEKYFKRFAGVTPYRYREEYQVT